MTEADVTAGIFADGGPLARHLPGFAPRAVQLRMAQAVAATLQSHDSLVVEAGTGTGKTFAYLVPALLSGRRVVISTGTLNLQDQLFYRDVPRVREALGAPVRVSLLKGRANYLCRHRLDKALQQPAARHERGRLQDVQAWARTTETGELHELGGLAEDDPLLPRITSSADNCLGAKCPLFEDCFVVKARRAAQAADVVIVNHHLLFADFALKEEGFGRILPGADAVIVDEAHQLAEIATRFFGSRVSTRQLHDLAQDCAAEATLHGDMPDLRGAALQLAEAASALEAAFAGAQARERLELFLGRPGAAPAMDQLKNALHELSQQLKPLADRTPELSACHLRAGETALRLDQLTDRRTEERVAWVEPAGRAGRGGTLNTTPIRVDEDFQRLRETQAGAWVFTSATLAAGADFSHFCGPLGLDDATTLRLESPFDFTRQARLYLPQNLPDPNAPEYSGCVARTALPIIEASGGGAFVLCTSHRALREIAACLRAQTDYSLLVQGEGSRTELLEAFTRDGNAVLVGTASFWEGVDVRGAALRVVIIDRLPFAAPGDPVFDARLAAIRETGGDPFTSYQLPQAIMALRQGAGRLIRDPQDRGLLVLCDPRLRTRPYGRRVLASLPAIPSVGSLGEAQAWLRQIRVAA